MPEFTERPGIFHNKDFLQPDHIPDDFEARETELKHYKNALYPIYKGEKPKNIFLQGDSGTGKTSLTRYLIKHLKIDAKEDEGIDINSIYINCEDLKNSYQLGIQITNTLREQRRNDTKENLPNQGYSKPDVFENLFYELEKRDGTTILILDEINNIEDYDLLYQIPRAHSNQKLSQDTNTPCIIGISNEVGYLSNIPPNVSDTLNEQVIQFNAYKSDTLKIILENRAKKAFYNDVLEQGVIPRCAGIAARDTGSARRALRLLRTAGDIARDNRESTVTIDHVGLAEKQIDKELVKDNINKGTIQTQIALLTVAIAASKKETPERTSNLYDHYEDVTDARDCPTLKPDRYRLRLETLSEGEIIKSKTKNDDGQYSQHELCIDIVVILNALAEDSRYDRCIYTIIKNALGNRLIRKRDLKETNLETILDDYDQTASLVETRTD